MLEHFYNAAQERMNIKQKAAHTLDSVACAVLLKQELDKKQESDKKNNSKNFK